MIGADSNFLQIFFRFTSKFVFILLYIYNYIYIQKSTILFFRIELCGIFEILLIEYFLHTQFYIASYSSNVFIVICLFLFFKLCILILIFIYIVFPKPCNCNAFQRLLRHWYIEDFLFKFMAFYACCTGKRLRQLCMN